MAITILSHTVSDLLFCSYANLAMAHDAVNRGIHKYDRTSYMIRARLLNGLNSGKMHIQSFFDDEKFKLENGARCVYCGSSEMLSVDHILPKIRGGSDGSDNLVCSCRRCNSSKSDSDLLCWYFGRNDFPPLLILRRYLKLVYQYCLEKGILDKEIDFIDDSDLPFSLKNIPINYPQSEILRLKC